MRFKVYSPTLRLVFVSAVALNVTNFMKQNSVRGPGDRVLQEHYSVQNRDPTGEIGKCMFRRLRIRFSLQHLPLRFIASHYQRPACRKRNPGNLDERGGKGRASLVSCPHFHRRFYRFRRAHPGQSSGNEQEQKFPKTPDHARRLPCGGVTVGQEYGLSQFTTGIFLGSILSPAKCMNA
jgi:hypothetical protein